MLTSSFILKSLKAFSQTDIGTALLITIVWKILMTICGFAIDSHFGGSVSLFDHTMRWDAGWYKTIIDGQYANNLASSAFYPLFPLLTGIIHFLGFGLFDYSIAGQIINTVAMWFALVALIKLARLLLGKKQRLWLIILVLSAPAAFFLHVFYSEAVFMALSFWAYYLALTHRWLGVGILLALLTATRLPSLLIVALCGLEFLKTYDWNPRKFFNKNILFFLLAPLGFIAYATYLSFAQHDALGMFHAYAQTTDWAYQVFSPNIIETVAKSAYQVVRLFIGLRPFDNEMLVNIILPLWSLILLLMSSLYLIFKHRQKLLPLGIVGILSFIMFTLNSNIVSVHRYILPSLTIYIAVALIAGHGYRKLVLYLWIISGLILQAFLYTAFIRSLFAG
ncbi:MAG: hypothetical protein WAV04_00870 [Candidatus Microsaccharimonas sp.]